MEKPKENDIGTVRKGILTGLTMASLIFGAGWMLLPVREGKLTSASDKLFFTLRWQILSGCVLIFGVHLIAGTRARIPGARDPTSAGAERLIGAVEARFLQNTLEQLAINTIGQLVLTTYLSDNLQRVMPCLVTIFVVGRILFYVGYKIHPLYRAPGFAMTFIPAVFVHVYCVYCLVVYGPLFGI